MQIKKYDRYIKWGKQSVETVPEEAQTQELLDKDLYQIF